MESKRWDRFSKVLEKALHISKVECLESIESNALKAELSAVLEEMHTKVESELVEQGRKLKLDEKWNSIEYEREVHVSPKDLMEKALLPIKQQQWKESILELAKVKQQVEEKTILIKQDECTVLENEKWIALQMEKRPRLVYRMANYRDLRISVMPSPLGKRSNNNRNRIPHSDRKRLKPARVRSNSEQLCVDFEPYTCILPTMYSTTHADVQVIVPSTVYRVLQGEFNHEFSNIVFIDCRYDYEFQGGAFANAIHLNDPASLEKYFFTTISKQAAKTAYIFYCEFSVQRAPKQLRHLRSIDRCLNAEKYPNLHYPELYLIEGGYRNCYLHHKIPCVLTSYISMDDEKYTKQRSIQNAKLALQWKNHKANHCAKRFQLL